MKKQRIYKAIFIIFTIGVALAIYHNSMFEIRQSDIQSGAVLKVFNRLFARAGIPLTLTQYLVRKSAHFMEYLIFGTVMTITLNISSKRLHQNLFFELFFLLAVPVLDEYIQIFYSGRNSSVTDIIIDFAGGLAGMGLCRLLIRLINRVRHGKTSS